jgi:hypothetical protein
MDVPVSTTTTDLELSKAHEEAKAFEAELGMNLGEKFTDPHFVLSLKAWLKTALERTNELRHVLKDNVLDRYVEPAIKDALVAVHALADEVERAHARGWAESRVQDVCSRIAADALTDLFEWDGRHTRCATRVARGALYAVARVWVEQNELASKTVLYDFGRGTLTLDAKSVSVWIRRDTRKRTVLETPSSSAPNQGSSGAENNA